MPVKRRSLDRTGAQATALWIIPPHLVGASNRSKMMVLTLLRFGLGERLTLGNKCATSNGYPRTRRQFRCSWAVCAGAHWEYTLAAAGADRTRVSQHRISG